LTKRSPFVCFLLAASLKITKKNVVGEVYSNQVIKLGDSLNRLFLSDLESLNNFLQQYWGLKSITIFKTLDIALYLNKPKKRVFPKLYLGEFKSDRCDIALYGRRKCAPIF
jgi:hypothetical protein